MYGYSPVSLQGERNVPGAPGNNAPGGTGNLAGNPFGAAFQIPQRGIRGMTPAQIQELKDWDPASAEEIDRIYRNIQPGGPKLFPSASTMGNMGNVAGLVNAQFFGGPHFGRFQGPGLQGELGTGAI
jgi:hypothetical protein